MCGSPLANPHDANPFWALTRKAVDSAPFSVRRGETEESKARRGFTPRENERASDGCAAVQQTVVPLLKYLLPQSSVVLTLTLHTHTQVQSHSPLECVSYIYIVPFSQQFFGSCQCTRTKAPQCHLYRGITIFPTFSILLGPSSVDDSTIFQFLITVTILVSPRQH